MRKLKMGKHRFTDVVVMDEPGEGGVCHEYSISGAGDSFEFPPYEFGRVKFQKGPVKEAGVNGCHHEDLIIIVIDRLQSFQANEFACRENALAITKLEEALHWLDHRTVDRVAQGVDGTSQHRS